MTTTASGATSHAVDVVEVERRGGDADQQLAGARNRFRHLVELQGLLRLAELVYAPRPHGRTLSQGAGRRMPNTSWSCVVDLSVFDEFPDDL
jgi:hypothetical protein